MQAQHERHLVAVFYTVDDFKGALGGLLKQGFDRARISVLANHDTVSDHFGGKVPPAEAMANRPDTPREDLDSEGAVDAAIRFIAETVSAIGTIGATGLAYAVGGPVGVAAAAADETETGVEDLLGRNVDRAMTKRFEESLADGGLVCWVHAMDDGEADAAREIFTAHRGSHIHSVNLAPPPGQRG
ncbi:MAG: hypothetical protein HOK81_14670 [Rhodospirillaceae bacterium]|nr:hypothetical protein [Rhodospirillaceae bacterium]